AGLSRKNSALIGKKFRSLIEEKITATRSRGKYRAQKSLSHPSVQPEITGRARPCTCRKGDAMHGDEDELKTENGTRSCQTLSDWLEAHKADLLTALRPFANLLYSTLGLTPEEIASELLVEVTGRALRNSSNYDPSRPPIAWLLGIARNVVLEWKDREIKW